MSYICIGEKVAPFGTVKRVAKIWLCVVAVLLGVGSVVAQERCVVSGRVADTNTGEAVLGAVVEVVAQPQGERVAIVTSGYKGAFELTLPVGGNYVLSVEYLGYETLHKELSIKSGKAVNLGTLRLKTSSIVMEDVSVMGSMIRTSIKGDTVSYNASAFKVSADASAHRMLAKMPGVAVSNTGIEVHGRDVKRVYVDGREFFGNDPMAAVKNIPADMIERIETYYHLSEQAEMTGVDDGEGYMAINIVTAEDKRNGWFGKTQLGVGNNGKGIVAGNLNRLNGDRHLALIGMWNNVNQYNFSAEDVAAAGDTANNGIFNVKPMNGVSAVGSFGINYNDQFRVSKIRRNGKVSLFYFFNDIDNDNTTTTDRETFTPTDKSVLYDAVAESHADRGTHQFGGRIDIPISTKHTITLRPQLSWQDSGTFTTTLSRTDNLYGGVDTTFVYRRKVLSDVGNYNYSLANNLSYNIRLKQKREYFGLSLYTRYNVSGMTSLQEQYNFKDIDDVALEPERASSKSFQNQLRTIPGYNIVATATYTMPISRKSVLSTSYRLIFNGSATDKKIYKSAKEVGDVTAWSEEYFREDLSNVFSTDYTTHRVGFNYKYGKDKSSITGGLFYQLVNYVGLYTFPKADIVRRSYGDLTYSLVGNYNFDSRNRIRVNATSKLSNPSPAQLQNVMNTSSSQFLRIGNPNLKQSYLHDIDVNYLRTIPSRGTSLSLTTRLRLNNRYIADELIVDQPNYVLPDGELLGEGNQFAKPVNMKGYWDLRVRAVYGIPLHFIKSNFNIRGTVGAGRVPSVLNGEPLKLENTWGELGAVLSSNISEWLDFTLSYSGSYTKSQTRFMNGFARNDNVSQVAKGELKYVTPHNFTLSTSVSWNDYNAVGADYHHDYTLCNIYIGRRILPRSLGEISIGVNDLFNQSAKIYQRSVSTTAVSEITNRGVGRYVAVQFVYNIRHYQRVGIKHLDK